MKNIYLILFGILLFLGSCTIEKRHYTGGYHVEWNSKLNKQTKASDLEQKSAAINEVTLGEVVVEPAAYDAPYVVIESKNGFPNKLNEESVMASASNEVEPIKVKSRMITKPNAQAYKSTKAEIREAKQTIRTLGKQDKEETQAPNTNAVVLLILCIFLPPLAVYLFDNAITTNFWVDLILSLLFWLPGMIFAFLVCFAGVSL